MIYVLISVVHKDLQYNILILIQNKHLLNRDINRPARLTNISTTIQLGQDTFLKLHIFYNLFGLHLLSKVQLYTINLF